MSNPCFCSAPKLLSAKRAYGRSWFQCEGCGLVYCAREDLPDPEEERRRYTHHQNSIEDARYLAYLNVLLEPLANYVSEGARGLDFGSGKEAVSAELLRRKGLTMRAWDPFFADDDTTLAARYDVICATEVVEHFHHPYESFSRIDALLLPNAVFGLLTQFWPGADLGFRDWFYARDRTHVCFYTRQTISAIAEHFSWQVLECYAGEKSSHSEPSAVIFRKTR